MSLMSALAYITNALVEAEFYEMKSEEFKAICLGPLDSTLEKSNINGRCLSLLSVGRCHT